MQIMKVKKIRFGSYIKLHMMISLSIGAVFGLLFLLFGILGGPVTANLGEAHYSGLTAGIIGFFLAPLMLLIFGLIMALLTFLPLILMMKFTNGIKLRGEFEAVYENASSSDGNQPEEVIETNSALPGEGLESGENNRQKE